MIHIQPTFRVAVLWSSTPSAVSSEQHNEALLTKVIVVRQYVADTSLAHSMHRDTIRQAIALVGPCFVKCETSHECVMAQWDYFDVRAAENSLGLGDCASTSLFAI